ncbi:dihydrolipoamide succinyltransferase, partial [Candidatus Woesearchaeota archaeon]|nr:dihydrolipoamide succinyltransferase [Candidatus Woesearchaeota archaeon]
MRLEITVPNLPESVNDATLLGWHKQPGDRLKRGENLIDLETDKVILEVPVPEDGVLLDIHRNQGDIVVGSDLLAVMETVEADVSPAEKPPLTPSLAESSPLSPAVRRMLLEHPVDPANITGSGREGRITRKDVQDYLDGQASDAASSDEPVVVVSGITPRAERRVPMTRLRARIAERLME